MIPKACPIDWVILGIIALIALIRRKRKKNAG